MLRCVKSTNNILLIALLALVLIGCRQEILHNLTESDANTLLTKLNSAGIRAKKAQDGPDIWSISVQGKDEFKALKYLSGRHAIRQSAESSAGKSGLLMNQEDKRFQLERTLSHEIENTLLTVGGTLDARVHLNLPLADPFALTDESSAGPSGSVLLLTSAEFSLSEDQVASIVAGAAGIARERLTVVLHREQQAQELSVGASSSADDFSTGISALNQAFWERLTAAGLDSDRLMKIMATLLVVGTVLLSLVFFRNWRGSER